MEKLVKYIQQEWSVVKHAPFTFITLVVLLFSAAFSISTWYYSGRIETMSERLSAKDDQLTDYRQRLHLAEASATKYSLLSNTELKRKALDISEHLRQLAKNNRLASDSGHTMTMQRMARAKTKEDREQLWFEGAQLSSQISIHMNSEYDSKFKTDAILLHDEILSRLPKETVSDKARYQFPTNPSGMEMVASDLEKLAKTLPEP